MKIVSVIYMFTMLFCTIAFALREEISRTIVSATFLILQVIIFCTNEIINHINKN